MQILTGALVISTTATFYLKSTLECFLTILLSPIGNHQGSNHLEVNRTGDSRQIHTDHQCRTQGEPRARCHHNKGGFSYQIEQ
jgi:hypothetical protein